MIRRYELTRAQYSMIEDLLPRETRRRGRPWNNHRSMLNGMLWILHTGAQWRELPERYGPWETVYGRLVRWEKDGTLDRVLERLRLRLNDRGLLDSELWCIDATLIRASRSAGGARHEKKHRTNRVIMR
jgi:transposase